MQRLNHHHLFLFWTFGRTGSVTKTAESLSIAQSAVTSQLRQLEDALGLSLIDRTHPRRPEITSEGRQVLAYAERIFESSRELIDWASRGSLPKIQRLRIGATPGLSRNLLYEFIRPLTGRPDLNFGITTGEQKTLIQSLISHDLDVLLTSQAVHQRAQGELYAHVLHSSPVVFVSSSGTGSRSKSRALDWSGKEVFIPGKSFETRPEIDAFLEGLPQNFRIAGEIDDVAFLRILALRTGAIVGVPEIGVKSELEAKILTRVSAPTGISQRYYAITRNKLNPSDHIKQLITELKAI